MHVHLTEPGKIAACQKWIDILNECHESGALAKYTGACNIQASALDKCLRQERLDRTARNREEAKLRKEKYEGTRRKYAEELGQPS